MIKEIQDDFDLGTNESTKQEEESALKNLRNLLITIASQVEEKGPTKKANSMSKLRYVER